MATKGLTDLPPASRPYLVDPPVIAPGNTFASVTEKVMRTVLTPLVDAPTRAWLEGATAPLNAISE